MINQDIIASYKPKYTVEASRVHNELTQYMLIDGYDLVLDLNSSNGANFIDSRTGKRYLDFFSCFASLPIGINHPKMMDTAFVDYIGRIAINKPSNSDITTNVMATFVKTFFATASIDAFNHLFLISGGALAVENALKAAFDWKVKKNFRKGYKFERGHQIIHFRNAFHGRSGYTMSLTNTDEIKTALYPKFDWPRITSPSLQFPLTDETIEATFIKEEIAVNEIKKSLLENKDDIAAIIIEPIQGEGGDNHFRKEFLEKLRQIADENDVLLIFDEIQTGVGITGKWWAHQHFDVVPDIMCFGKKMQICGILANSRIDQVPDNVFKIKGRINSTWGGSLVDMARATKYLEIIDEENLVEYAAIMGDELLEKLRDLAAEFPQLISNVRGLGLFCAFDLPDQTIRDKIKLECFKNNLLILGSGKNSIRFRTPLNITTEEIEEGINIIQSILKKIS